MATILLRMPVEAEPKVVYDVLASTEGVTGGGAITPRAQLASGPR
jgi:hypothetical protein